jgi:hypothetical protein
MLACIAIFHSTLLQSAHDAKRRSTSSSHYLMTAHKTSLAAIEKQRTQMAHQCNELYEKARQALLDGDEKRSLLLEREWRELNPGFVEAAIAGDAQRIEQLLSQHVHPIWWQEAWLATNNAQVRATMERWAAFNYTSFQSYWHDEEFLRTLEPRLEQKNDTVVRTISPKRYKTMNELNMLLQKADEEEEKEAFSDLASNCRTLYEHALQHYGTPKFRMALHAWKRYDGRIIQQAMAGNKHAVKRLCEGRVHPLWWEKAWQKSNNPEIKALLKHWSVLNAPAYAHEWSDQSFITALQEYAGRQNNTVARAALDNRLSGLKNSQRISKRFN